MSVVRTNEPSLRALAFVLRNPETWPKGFQWYYGSCSTCAMGLAEKLWPQAIKNVSTHDMVDAFKISMFQAHKIFLNPELALKNPDYKRPSRLSFIDSMDENQRAMEYVSPAMVADAIDEVINQQENRGEETRTSVNDLVDALLCSIRDSVEARPQSHPAGYRSYFTLGWSDRDSIVPRRSRDLSRV